MVIRALVVWCAVLVMAILNGTMREFLLTPRVGAPAGHWISTAVLCAVVLLVSRLTIRWMGPRRARQALAIGGGWVLLTVAFEFLAGHYVFGHPWERLLADYNVLRGRVWALVLVTTLVAPLWAFRRCTWSH